MNEFAEQDANWEKLYRLLVNYFSRLGTNNAYGEGDFWVHDDNLGPPFVRVHINNLALLTNEIIRDVKHIVDGFPGFTVALAVDIVGKEKEWPLMGVTIRPHEIIDGLQRKYLPERFRFFKIPGSRPGTGWD